MITDYINNVLHKCRCIVSAAVLMLPLWVGCSGGSAWHEPPEEVTDDDKGCITLDLSVGVNNGIEPTSRAFTGPDYSTEGPVSEYEKVHTLRVVIVRHVKHQSDPTEYIVEHNRMVNVRESYSNQSPALITSYYVINDNLQFKVIADEMKTVYLFANEAAVNLNKEGEEIFNFATELKVGEKFPTEKVQNILIKRVPKVAYINNESSEKHYIPMSEFFNIKVPATSGVAEEFYSKTLFLTRSLIKFSFSVAYKTDGFTDTQIEEFNNLSVKLKGVVITDLADASYYLPCDTKYNPPKYPEDRNELDLDSNLPSSTGDRTITSFTVPPDIVHSNYVFLFSQDGLEITSDGFEISPAVYFPESTGNHSLSLWFSNKQKPENEENPENEDLLRSIEIDDIPRNTHVKINITITPNQDITLSTTVLPYTGVWLDPVFGL